MTHLGEVLESSTPRFTAQARELAGAPAFGSVVRIDNGESSYYAVVSAANTGSIEPNRRPGAYGLNREQLEKNQPQIFELLKTDFSGILIGYSENGLYYGYLPPSPAQIHSFVYSCAEAEIRQIADNANYLRQLCTANLEGADELVAATLRFVARTFPDPGNYLITSGRELLRILRDDYDRLKSILARVGSVSSTCK